MNKVFLIGNLTKDTEHGVTKNNIYYCNFTIAVNRSYTDSNGERQVDFFNIRTWRGIAESCAKYLVKGKKVCVSGELQQRTYEDNQGVKRTVIEIQANEVEFLSPIDKKQEEQTDKKQTNPYPSPSHIERLPVRIPADTRCSNHWQILQFSSSCPSNLLSDSNDNCFHIKNAFYSLVPHICLQPSSLLLNMQLYILHPIYWHILSTS